MNLLYITFGEKPEIHLQAAFSIYSFLAQSSQVNTINLITDNPDFYKHLEEQVNIILVTQEELIAWQGEYQFFWRVKIKAIEKLCTLYPGEPIMYLDTDTYVCGTLISIKRNLIAGSAFMHENEGFLSCKKSKTEKKMWKQIKGCEFGKLTMQATDSMWNAGVVATPNNQKGKEMDLALTICDEMCKMGVTRRLIEQYAISLALESIYGLTEVKTDIIHYWSAKEIWNKHLQLFFIQVYFKQWSTQKIIEQIQLFDVKKLPAFQRVRNTNLRLKKIIDHIFPTKELYYTSK